jgi:ribosomal protein L7Ae-like RNA K-turn-binding protein
MNKLASMLGLATKAGQLVTGTAAVEAAIHKRQVYLVICATDLSPKTIKNFRFFCEQQQIKFFSFGLRSELSGWIGCPGRGIIGVVSKKFADVILSLIEDARDPREG